MAKGLPTRCIVAKIKNSVMFADWRKRHRAQACAGYLALVKPFGGVRSTRRW